jgi:hypothetical protein
VECAGGSNFTFVSRLAPQKKNDGNDKSQVQILDIHKIITTISQIRILKHENIKKSCSSLEFTNLL